MGVKANTRSRRNAAFRPDLLQMADEGSLLVANTRRVGFLLGNLFLCPACNHLASLGILDHIEDPDRREEDDSGHSDTHRDS